MNSNGLSFVGIFNYNFLGLLNIFFLVKLVNKILITNFVQAIKIILYVQKMRII